MMSSEKTAKLVANQLMVVFKEAEVANPTEAESMAGYSWHRAPSGLIYLLKAESTAALKRATSKLTSIVDGYPVDQCIMQLKDIVVSEKDMGTPLNQAEDRIRTQVLDFLRRFEKKGEWEVVFATRGIDPNQCTFNIEPCSFYLMDDEQFSLWGSRFYSGKYNPPASTPFNETWLRESEMKGQFVAAAKVRAIDHVHAMTKARSRIEEAINLLRYGQLVVGFPENDFPAVGFWIRQWHHDHSFAVQIDRPNFGTHRRIGGTDGNNYACSNRAPGWSGLAQVILIDRSARNEMQLRLTNALQWIGQAALAPSTSIKLVALVTALETLLFETGESLGKKTKFAKRISALVARIDEDKLKLTKEVEELYRNRSECVHGGEIEVSPPEIERAVRLLARTIEALVTKLPYCTTASLQAILDHIDPPSTSGKSERLRWINDNAYLRWIGECKPNNREHQHWLDAEREYLCNRNLKS